MLTATCVAGWIVGAQQCVGLLTTAPVDYMQASQPARDTWLRRHGYRETVKTYLRVSGHATVCAITTKLLHLPNQIYLHASEPRAEVRQSVARRPEIDEAVLGVVGLSQARQASRLHPP